MAKFWLITACRFLYYSTLQLLETFDHKRGPEETMTRFLSQTAYHLNLHLRILMKGFSFKGDELAVKLLTVYSSLLGKSC